MILAPPAQTPLIQRPAVKAMARIAYKLPWERLLLMGLGMAAVAVTNSPTATKKQAEIQRPGCTAADNAIVAKGHLQGLADGRGGFGVLKISQQRLSEGAAAADQLGRTHLAGTMRGIASEMGAVRSREKAQELATKLDPVIDEAWRLGRVCGLKR